eukprot:TRINITY_DN9333_c0_g1_i1.p1 TRINITY_DN9333_c0_g1~~TRINITY_DN9333_c0_g1_i1.p1  ORF type:complete len:375 (+),score=100.79 TRINITY_DN9333_c0_g1_i1:92-1216(+)
MSFSRTVVIDNGTGTIKAGFSGEALPTLLFANVVGTAKYPVEMVGGTLGQDARVVGENALTHRGVLKLSYPMEHATVSQWSDMESVWSHVFAGLEVESKDHPVLLTEAPLSPDAMRTKAAEIFFEKFHAPALFFSVQGVLALYAASKTSGCVLDIGDGVTQVCPVYEGCVIPGAVSRADYGGRDVTRYLQRILRQAGHNFDTSAGFDIVRQIKEQHCQVSGLAQEQVRSGRGQDFSKCALPDGTAIQLYSERYKAPEVLFDPQRMWMEHPGCTQLLVNSIKKCDLDVRKCLLSELMLSGGSTLFKNFGERAIKDLRREFPTDAKVKLHAPPTRKYSTWTGGAILSNLSSFRRMMVTAEEYKEHGEARLFRKSFL